jgi:hypothetical protein
LDVFFLGLLFPDVADGAQEDVYERHAESAVVILDLSEEVEL